MNNSTFSIPGNKSQAERAESSVASRFNVNMSSLNAISSIAYRDRRWHLFQRHLPRVLKDSTMRSEIQCGRGLPAGWGSLGGSDIDKLAVAS